MKKFTQIKMLILFLFLTQFAFSQRLSESINSSWLFHKGNHVQHSIPDEDDYWIPVNLPHTWNAEDTIDDQVGYYRGEGWYSKQLFIDNQDKGKQFYLYFEGVNQVTDLYLNGQHIGNHKGGYTAFSFDITPYLKYDANNKIEVRVDNSHNENIAPLSGDFNFYGGIYRNVKLIKTDPIHFDMSNEASDGVFVNYSEVNSEQAILKFDGVIQNDSPLKETIELKVEIEDSKGQLITEKSKSLVLDEMRSHKFTIEEMIVSNPILWSPENPYLYKAKLTLVKGLKEDHSNIDHIVLPVGIKTMSFDDQGRFILNGSPLKLIGSNRHQDIEGYGNALTDDQHYDDYKKIKELGFNFVRLAHYPQAPEVYKACDELGLLVWSEIPVVNEITENESFTSNSLQMQKEHIRQTYNHPSVILYGYMNETFLLLGYSRLPEDQKLEKSKKIVTLAKALNKLTKKEAPNHYSVMAFHGNERYNEAGLGDIPDVVGWNLYYGWYNGQIEDLSQFLIAEHEKYPKRKMIVSEFGPGADIRLHTNAPKAWDYSEDFQILMHGSYLKQMMDLEFLTGFAVWNFADFGSEIRNDAKPYVNQKGLLNFDRTYKDVAYLYKSWFSDTPIAHIASRNYLQRTAVESDLTEGTSQDKLIVFTNKDHIDIAVNGKLTRDLTPVDHQVAVQVELENGKNLIEVYSDSQVMDRLEIENRVIPKNLDTSSSIDIAVNVGSEVSFYDVQNKVLWMEDQEYDQNIFGYIGGENYIDKGYITRPGISKNINGTQNDPLYQTFNEGIESYYFDVPDGVYQLSLLFQEYQDPNSDQNIVYNLNQDESKKVDQESRVFDIYANEQLIKSKLNIGEMYGALNAAHIEFEMDVNENKGLKIDFRPIQGQPLLSGIRIKQTN